MKSVKQVWPKRPLEQIINELKAMQSPKSRLIAFLLCLFLGGIGVHRFYVAKVGTGVFQLLLTLSVVGIVISGPWAIVDWIMIMAGAFKDKEGRKLTNWNAN